MRYRGVTASSHVFILLPRTEQGPTEATQEDLLSTSCVINRRGSVLVWGTPAMKEQRRFLVASEVFSPLFAPTIKSNFFF